MPLSFLVFSPLTTQFDKFQVGAFGRCPRVYCQGQNVLPAGLSDVPRNCTVAVYCPKCQVRCRAQVLQFAESCV